MSRSIGVKVADHHTFAGASIIRLMRAACLVALIAVGALVVPAAHAQGANFDRDCSQWIEKKGFSTDYIKLRTGKRQRGMADGWRGNVEPKDVQPGDVVITYIKDKGRRMRVSYVEDVRRNGDGRAGAVIVTEWNEGNTSTSRASSPTTSAATRASGRSRSTPSCGSGGRACHCRTAPPTEPLAGGPFDSRGRR